MWMVMAMWRWAEKSNGPDKCGLATSGGDFSNKDTVVPRPRRKMEEGKNLAYDTQ